MTNHLISPQHKPYHPIFFIRREKRKLKDPIIIVASKHSLSHSQMGMGRPSGDHHHIALHHHHHSSIALLQERFRQLQRVKEMRQERELLKTVSSSSSLSSSPSPSSSPSYPHHHRDQMHYEPPPKHKALFHTDLFFPPGATTKPSSQLSLSLWPPASSPESCSRPGAPQSSAGKRRINDMNLAHNNNSSTLPMVVIKHDHHDPYPDVDTSLHL